MLAWLKKLWPFPWPWQPEDVPDPTHPILLIPGICGTQLAVRKKSKDKKSADNGSLVWVRVEEAVCTRSTQHPPHPTALPHGPACTSATLQDNQYKRLWGQVKPGSNHLDLLDESLEVCVPSKAGDGGLYSVDVLDPSLYLPLHVIYYFHNLIWFLNKHKYVAGKSLFGFGYDFRQSNMIHLDALQARLEEASAAAKGVKCAPDLSVSTSQPATSPGGGQHRTQACQLTPSAPRATTVLREGLPHTCRVDVITHSMGGLVMRSFLAARPDTYARLVRKWVAIASPFGGAPGFGMDALMTGVQFCQVRALVSHACPGPVWQFGWRAVRTGLIPCHPMQIRPRSKHAAPGDAVPGAGLGAVLLRQPQHDAHHVLASARRL